MRILIIAFPESIHTARWISQIADQGWDIHLFPSTDNDITHPDLRNITVHYPFYVRPGKSDSSVKFRGIPVFSKRIAYLGKRFLTEIVPQYRIYYLQRVIEKLQPDIIHSMEMQHSGYLTAAAKKRIGQKFPPWIVTNWGSDIYLFGKLSEHEPKIREVLAQCDYYSCECNRDVSLAWAFGFKGKILPVFPNTGGFNLNDIARLRHPGLISERRTIMLKGYQSWAGRALIGLRALERCADLLKDYEIVIYNANSDVVIAAELFSKSTGINIKIIPYGTPHKEILRFHGKARISIGLSIGDAISTSFLEAFVMGSFPIQSWTSCANEWIEDGKTGILVHPNDSEVVESAIRRALTEDTLVNNAAKINYCLAEEKLDYSILKSKAMGIYTAVANRLVKK